MNTLKAQWYFAVIHSLWILLTDGSETTESVPTCPDLWAPPNSVLIESGFTPGSIATYSCKEWYELEGESERVCGSDGTWSDHAPTCTAIGCGPLTNPNHGRVTFNSTIHNSEATYECETSYVLGTSPTGSEEINEGNDTVVRRCLSTGMWDGGEPTCVDSGTVPPCETEYYKERCFWKIEQTLTWAEALTACEAQAGTLATLDTQDMLDFVLGNLTGVGIVKRYIGLTDGHTEGVYRWTDTSAVTSGHWDGSISTGNNVNCGVLEYNGKWDLEECSNRRASICMAYQYGPPECDTLEEGCLGLTSDNWTCHRHRCAEQIHVQYQNISDISQCQKLCQVRTDIYCRAIDFDSKTGECRLSHASVAVTTSYNCELCERTPLLRNFSDVCIIKVLGRLSFPETMKHCDNISGVQGQLMKVMSIDEHNAITPIISNGEYFIGLTQIGDNEASWKWINGTYPEWEIWKDGKPDYNNDKNCAMYKEKMWDVANCDEDYKFLCETTLTATCEAFPEIGNASHFVDYVNKQVIYICNTLNVSFADGNLTKTVLCECEMDVNLIPELLGNCYEVDCGTPEISDGNTTIVSFNSTGYLAEAVYQLNCSEGYVVQGNTTRICLSSRQWSGETPYCAPVSCGNLSNPINGTVTFADTVYTSVANYVCDVGYVPVGNEKRRCTANGTWSGLEPVCEVSIHPCETIYYRDVCLWLTTESLDWASSLKKCELDHGTLAVIWDNDMNNFVKNNLQGAFASSPYVGLSDGHTEGTFRWIDTRVPVWVNWDSIGAKDTSDCVYANTYGKWRDTSCESTRKALCIGWKGNKPKCTKLTDGCLGLRNDTWYCETGSCLGDSYDVMYTGVATLADCQEMCQHRIDFNCRELEFYNGDCKMKREENIMAVQCPDSEIYCKRTTHFRDMNDICLTKFTSSRTTDTAQETCEGIGGNLVSIRSLEEHNYIKNNYMESGFQDIHIGLKQVHESYEGVWNWRDGTFPEWSLWQNEYPQKTSQKSCARYNDFVWRDEYCAASYRDYLCERPKIEKCQSLPQLANAVGYLNTSNYVYTYTCMDCHAFPDGNMSISLTCDCGLDPDTILTTISPCEEMTTCLTTLPSLVSTDESHVAITTDKPTTSDEPSSTSTITTPTSVSMIESHVAMSTDKPTTSEETSSISTITTAMSTLSSTSITSRRVEPDTTTTSSTSTTSKMTTTKGEDSNTVVINKIPMCSEPTAVTNAHITESVRLIGGFTTYECDSDHHFEIGGTIRTVWCLQNGQWSTTVKGCMAKSCHTISESLNATISTNRTSAGSSVTLTCRQGLLLDTGLDTTDIQCTAGAQWSQAITHCIERCEAIPFVENAELVPSDSNKYGLNVTLRCLRGYRFSDGTKEKQMTCSELGWSDTGNCIVDVCPSLESYKSQVRLSTMQAVYGTRVQASCPPGFTFFPDQQHIWLECMELGLWNDSIPQCNEVRCPQPTSIDNAVQTGNGTLFGSLVTYTCIHADELPYRHQDGYTTKTIECLQSGQWTEHQLSCEKERCEPLPVLDNASPDSQNASWGSIIVYHCNHGYQFEGGETYMIASCLYSWNISTQYSCSRVTCGAVDSSPPILYVTSTGGHFGDTTFVTCAEGHAIDGNTTATLHCAQDKRWHLTNAPSTTYTGCQAISCGKPPDIDNAQLSDTGNHSYKAQQVLRCRHGYWFSRDVTSLTIECSSNRTWTPVVKGCQEITCPAVGSWSGHVTNASSWRYQSYVNVSCTAGFRMSDNSSFHVYYCTELGSWDKDIVPCIATTAAQPFSPPPKEAPAASTIAAIGAVMITVALAIILVADIPSFAMAFISLRSNIKDYLYSTNPEEFGTLKQKVM